jgi:hypothetical protein
MNENLRSVYHQFIHTLSLTLPTNSLAVSASIIMSKALTYILLFALAATFALASPIPVSSIAVAKRAVPSSDLNCYCESDNLVPQMALRTTDCHDYERVIVECPTAINYKDQSIPLQAANPLNGHSGAAQSCEYFA